MKGVHGASHGEVGENAEVIGEREGGAWRRVSGISNRVEPQHKSSLDDVQSFEISGTPQRQSIQTTYLTGDNPPKTPLKDRGRKRSIGSEIDVALYLVQNGSSTDLIPAEETSPDQTTNQYASGVRCVAYFTILLISLLVAALLLGWGFTVGLILKGTHFKYSVRLDCADPILLIIQKDKMFISHNLRISIEILNPTGLESQLLLQSVELLYNLGPQPCETEPRVLASFNTLENASNFSVSQVSLAQPKPEPERWTASSHRASLATDAELFAEGFTTREMDYCTQLWNLPGSQSRQIVKFRTNTTLVPQNVQLVGEIIRKCVDDELLFIWASATGVVATSGFFSFSPQSFDSRNYAIRCETLTMA